MRLTVVRRSVRDSLALRKLIRPKNASPAGLKLEIGNRSSLSRTGSTKPWNARLCTVVTVGGQDLLASVK